MKTKTKLESIKIKSFKTDINLEKQKQIKGKIQMMPCTESKGELCTQYYCYNEHGI